TIAGLPGRFGTNDGNGSDALFASPVSLALDAQTNLFVADSLSHTIRKVSFAGSNWVVSTIGGSAGLWGSADASDTQARFKHPGGIATDAAGNLYVADTDNNTIRFGSRVSGTSDSVSLQASLLGGQIIIAWPASASGFNLEINTNLGVGSFWFPVTTSPAV